MIPDKPIGYGAMGKPDFVQANGARFAVHTAGTGPAVILLHGFPELAFSWRHQFAALAAAGWRVVAPDLRGYGDTGPQGPISAYSMRNLSFDVLGIMDALGIDRAALVGHDFGGALAWSVARDHPGRISAVASLNTPYTHRATHDLAETMRQRRGEANYMVQFQVPGRGEALLERDVEATFRGLLRRPSVTLAEFRQLGPRLQALPMSLFVGEPEVMGAPLLTEDELAVYVAAFAKNGFTGALNWYRNLAQNWSDTAAVADRVNVPALMVSAQDDYFLPPETASGMERYVADLERATLDRCGHWTQQERPDETSALLLAWLERRVGADLPQKQPQR